MAPKPCKFKLFLIEDFQFKPPTSFRTDARLEK